MRRCFIDGHIFTAPVDDVLLIQLVFMGRTQYNHSFHCFSAIRITGRNNARFLNSRMLKHQRFHFSGPHFEARSIDHAFESIGDEEISVFINTA